MTIKKMHQKLRKLGLQVTDSCQFLDFYKKGVPDFYGIPFLIINRLKMLYIILLVFVSVR